MNRLIGLSPETPDASLATVREKHIDFDVLSDVGNVVARRYGLRMDVPEVYRSVYLEMGLDVPAANGDDSRELPLPATCVVDTGGMIRGGFVDHDDIKRMEPADIVKVLQSLR